ncbi:fructose-specific PTS transporter subunit EIIC [Aerococcus sanguinicola]|uniref:fructose-specific PTS transporter subunit EIIC n=1 Tax=Aerococcus sanguinicola TaxID=119206 RepID=UPI0018A709F1|nr:fructose-specific PTS transporter subunit EIIC [Aerococcus sanguinicola]
MNRYKIIAATGCPTGIAHTYMAQEALEEAAKKHNVAIKVETHGQSGVENELSIQDIQEADVVIIAADKDVNVERFDGKPLINVSVSAGMKRADDLIQQALDKDNLPIYRSQSRQAREDQQTSKSSSSWLHSLYVFLMNGVSHMLPIVVAGGVLIAISFFWGINSADPASPEYNEFASVLNQIGGLTMNLMVPVLSAYIAEAMAKRSGLVVGFATGMIAYTNGTGFLGGILSGFLSGYIIMGLNKLLKGLPKSLDGLKSIFLLPVLGVLITGFIVWYLSIPMKEINEGMMAFLKNMENSSPIVLGAIVGIMSAADFGGPVNKAAYLTGTALLAQGNYYFMAGVSAACIAPPLATGFAVLFNRKAYTDKERSAGLVNFLLGSTHITEGAIPFAATNPLINIPIFMLGSSVAAILTYMSKITVPAPHGGFIVLPLVNKPLLWVVNILIGAAISGFLLSLVAKRQEEKHQTDAEHVQVSEGTNQFKDILFPSHIKTQVQLESRDDALTYLSDFAQSLSLAEDAQSVLEKFIARENEFSTAMENGIAIPHAQSEAITKPGMLIIKLQTPIEWSSLDDEKVDTLISFLIPASDKGDQHLNYLSNTAKKLVHQDFVDQLKQANDPMSIYELFVGD